MIKNGNVKGVKAGAATVYAITTNGGVAFCDVTVLKSDGSKPTSSQIKTLSNDDKEKIAKEAGRNNGNYIETTKNKTSEAPTVAPTGGTKPSNTIPTAAPSRSFEPSSTTKPTISTQPTTTDSADTLKVYGPTNVEIGKSIRLYTNVSYAGITWTLENSKGKAKLNSTTGSAVYLTGVEKGYVKITALNPQNGKKFVKTVYVVEAKDSSSTDTPTPTDSISKNGFVLKGPSQVKVGEEATYTVTKIPDSYNGKSVQLAVGDPNILAVKSGGGTTSLTVTAKKKGTTTVRIVANYKSAGVEISVTVVEADSSSTGGSDTGSSSGGSSSGGSSSGGSSSGGSSSGGSSSGGSSSGGSYFGDSGTGSGTGSSGTGSSGTGSPTTTTTPVTTYEPLPSATSYKATGDTIIRVGEYGYVSFIVNGNIIGSALKSMAYYKASQEGCLELVGLDSVIDMEQNTTVTRLVFKGLKVSDGPITIYYKTDLSPEMTTTVTVVDKNYSGDTGTKTPTQPVSSTTTTPAPSTTVTTTSAPSTTPSTGEPTETPTTTDQPPVVEPVGDDVNIDLVDENGNKLDRIFVKLGEYQYVSPQVSGTKTSYEVKMTIDNTDIASVDEDGNIKGKKEGTTSITITLKFADGTVKKIERSVVCQSEGGTLELLPTTLEMNVGEEKKITVYKDSKSKYLLYYSSSPRVAMARGDGTIVAYGKGTCEIYAIQNGEQSNKIKVSVY